METRSGEAPVGDVKISDSWFRRTASMASASSYSRLVPTYRSAKSICFSVYCSNRL